MSTQPQTVSLAFKENIKVCQDHGKVDFEATSNESNYYEVVGTPTVVELRHGKAGFKLPPTLILSIITNDNKEIAEIMVNPQLGLLKLDDAITLIKQLTKTFEDAGWIPDPTDPHPPLEKLRDIFDGKEGKSWFDNNDLVDAGSWVHGEKLVYITIKKEAKENELLEFAKFLGGFASTQKYADLYLLQVKIINNFIPRLKEDVPHMYERYVQLNKAHGISMDE